MSLFSTADIERISAQAETVTNVMTTAFDIAGAVSPVTLGAFSEIEKHIGSMMPGAIGVFFSDGSWSNYELMEYLLNITGPALCAFTTWSISEMALSRMQEWVSSGRIIDLYAVLDIGIRNRKPHIYQQALGALKKLHLTQCHAKVLALVSPEISFLVIGSANFTKNPRKEAGVIFCDRSAAENGFDWIKNIVDGGKL